MDNSKAEWILGRLESIIDRWDKEEYTSDSLPMRGLLADLRQIVAEEGEKES